MAEKKSHLEAATGIDPQLVEILGEIATRLDLSEVEVAHGDLKIRVARQISVAPIPVATVAAAPRRRRLRVRRPRRPRSKCIPA